MKAMRSVLIVALVVVVAAVMALGAGCAAETASDDTGNGTENTEPADEGGEAADDDTDDGAVDDGGDDGDDGADDEDDATDEDDDEDEGDAESITVSLYWVSAGENALGVMREIPYTEAVASATMKELLAGPTDAEKTTWPAISTAIPEGSELLGLTIDDGIAKVDLSEEFESGGGTFSVTARLAQVVYTLEQFETIDAVEFYIEGELVEVFSSEGLILDGPQGLDDFSDLLPIDA